MNSPLPTVKAGPFITILTLTTMLWSALSCSNEPTQASTPDLKRWAYIVPQSFRASNFQARLQKYEVLCIGVYRLNERGLLYATPRLSSKQWGQLKQARRRRFLYPLISLRHARAGARMLASPKARAGAVRRLDALVRREKYDGIHIDFEFLASRHRGNFIKFLIALRRTPAMRGRVLSIAAFPPIHGTPDQAAFFDPAKLAPHLDQIVYMTYDYHLARPGPVTHLGWAEKNMRLALKHISPDRVWLGVPGYGYEWTYRKLKNGRGRPRALGERTAKILCARYGCKRHDSGTLELKRPGRIAYVMDPKMRRDMAALGRKLKVRGTALWRIGFEME